MTINFNNAIEICRANTSAQNGYLKYQSHFDQIFQLCPTISNLDGILAFSLQELVKYKHKQGDTALAALITAINDGKTSLKSLQPGEKKSISGTVAVSTQEKWLDIHADGLLLKAIKQWLEENHVTSLDQAVTVRPSDAATESQITEYTDIGERAKYFAPLRLALPECCKLVSSFSDSGRVDIHILSVDFLQIHKDLEAISGLVLEAMQPARCIEKGMERIGYRAVGKFINPTANGTL